MVLVSSVESPLVLGDGFAFVLGDGFALGDAFVLGDAFAFDLGCRPPGRSAIVSVAAEVDGRISSLKSEKSKSVN